MKLKNVVFLFYHHIMKVLRSVLALSIGRPIITTNIPGAKETVKDKINGFNWKGKYFRFARKMKWFIDNQDPIKKWVMKVSN